MTQTNDAIPAREIMDDIMPKLASIQSFVDHRLSASIQRQDNVNERKREENLKAELEMELTIIRMNIDNLIKRHEPTLSRLGVSRQSCGPDIDIDKHEAAAIEHLKRLYQRIRTLYADS
ncbi:hypothetical protein BCL93_101414 [Onishia taeanensis]|uniref:Uncharacterized protein n=1 Tax=Onishia taeanensis TaxID=284577 RepID=A0A328XZ49_9GAMM|nr:hypothetical protein [Halomonas taeanensis]RAR64592.1 hypothetical protein BCL93_101414 [Halomonas taeanensis]